jgi:hypothetical protein
LFEPASSTWHRNDERGFGKPTASGKFFDGWGACTAAQIAAETTLLPPFSPNSHSIVPGGFDVWIFAMFTSVLVFVPLLMNRSVAQKGAHIASK